MVLSKSDQMSRVRNRNTTPERRLRAALWNAGLRYRIHARTPGGRPDVVFPRLKVAVFVDGCFWHGCPQHYSCPRTRLGYWSQKLRKNLERDRSQTLRLEAAGWSVIRVWGHEVEQNTDEVVELIRLALEGRNVARTPDWRVIRVLPAEDSVTEMRHQQDLRNPRLLRVEEVPRVTGRRR